MCITTMRAGSSRIPPGGSTSSPPSILQDLSKVTLAVDAVVMEG
jgi:hypothetical protein